MESTENPGVAHQNQSLEIILKLYYCVVVKRLLEKVKELLTDVPQLLELLIL